MSGGAQIRALRARPRSEQDNPDFALVIAMPVAVIILFSFNDPPGKSNVVQLAAS